MSSILAVTFPFFALMLCGHLAARRGVLPESAIPGLNAFVLYFALPCLLFRFGASTPFAQLVDPWLVAVYTVCALLIVGGTFAATRQQVGRKDAAFGALVAAFPNTGFMGVPLIVALFGERAAGPVITTVLVDLVVTSSLCLAIAESHARHGPGASPLARALRGVLGNPLPWAIALGAVTAASGLALPEPVEKAIGMLADAASPVALFTIGAVLWRAGRQAHARTPPAHFVPVALVKLFVHPALVLGAGLAWRAAGGDVPLFGLAVLALAAGLPSASNVSMLAERHGADNGRIARIILASTVLSFATFSMLATLVAPLLGQ